MPTFKFESLHNGLVAGLDEAGCGPWAGPVLAGAVILVPEKLPAFLLDGLNDSKKISALKRQKLYTCLQEEEGKSCFSAWGLATVEEIDHHNIRVCAQMAMIRALEKLPHMPSHLLIDGTHSLSCPIPQTSIIKGDQHSYSIAAASIIAKVTRDHLMTQLSQMFPMYGWDRNAGYGTQRHQHALKEHGITIHHRKSFKPIAALLSVNAA